jgi:glycosyltransferase involved in cell wall biosynthesis
LYIAGSGSVIYEATLKKKYEDPRVYFVGYVKGEEFYPSLDATVVPSLWDEPLGMVVAESLMYGIPVIASRRGGIPEMVVDNKNGLLFEPQGHELGHSLQQFVSVLPDWRVRSEAIRRNAKHFQDMSAWILEWRQIYNSVARQQNHDK